jgi:hypothetical protein
MDIVKLIGAIIIIVVVLYVGALLFKEMVITLWTLSPLTSIGFIISVIVAILRRKFCLSKGADNIKTLTFIFGGTVISYAATTLIPSLKRSLFSGDWISVIIMGCVIAILWFRGQEIKDQN